MLFDCTIAIAQSNQSQTEPFEGIDQTWQNGSDRRDSSVFKNWKYFTPSLIVDVNYTHSFNPDFAVGLSGKT